MLSFILCVLEFVFGFVLPAYGSLWTLSKGKNASNVDHRRWGAYWITFAFLRFLVFPVLDHVPGFLETIMQILRLAMILYLVLPQTKGSLVVWNKVLTNESLLTHITTKVADIGSKVQKPRPE